MKSLLTFGALLVTIAASGKFLICLIQIFVIKRKAIKTKVYPINGYIDVLNKILLYQNRPIKYFEMT